MSAKEIIDAIIEAMRVLTAWPVILVLLILLLRKPLANYLPSLMHRIHELRIGDFYLKLSEVKSLAAAHNPDLLKQLLLQVSPNALRHGEPDYVEESEAEEREEELGLDILEEEEHALNEESDTLEFSRAIKDLQQKIIEE